VIERGVLGVHPILAFNQSYGLEHASSLIVYALLGAAAGVVALAFTEGLLRLRLWFRSLRIVPAWAHPAVGGLVTGVLAVGVLRTLHVTGVTGGGYETLGRALAGGLGFRVLIALCAVKLVATVFSYSSGGAGGIFAPSLFVGAMLGGAFGYADVLLFGHGHQQLGSFALVGMGAVFAGVIRAPITSVLIIFEMTGGYGLVLPLMIANMTAYALARHLQPEPVYEALLAQDGIELPHAARTAHVLERLTVADAMSTPPQTLPAELPLADAATLLSAATFAYAPVLDATGAVHGGVHVAKLRHVAEHAAEMRVDALLEPLHSIEPSAPLIQAVVRMTDLSVRQLCVVSESAEHVLLGMVAISDIVTTHARAVSNAAPGLTAEPADA
jgi:CIC family chloride channel protein